MCKYGNAAAIHRITGGYGQNSYVGFVMQQEDNEW